MDTGFYRKKHNPQFFSGTARSPLSLFSEGILLSASAALSAYGTAMLQLDNRPSGLYAEVPGVYGDVVRSGSTSATEASCLWFMAQAGTSRAHAFPYAEDIAAGLLASGWTPTGR
jgi:hypothetical protein